MAYHQFLFCRSAFAVQVESGCQSRVRPSLARFLVEAWPSTHARFRRSVVSRLYCLRLGLRHAGSSPLWLIVRRSSGLSSQVCMWFLGSRWTWIRCFTLHRIPTWFPQAKLHYQSVRRVCWGIDRMFRSVRASLPSDLWPNSRFRAFLSLYSSSHGQVRNWLLDFSCWPSLSSFLCVPYDFCLESYQQDLHSLFKCFV